MLGKGVCGVYSLVLEVEVAALGLVKFPQQCWPVRSRGECFVAPAADGSEDMKVGLRQYGGQEVEF